MRIFQLARVDEKRVVESNWSSIVTYINLRSIRALGRSSKPFVFFVTNLLFGVFHPASLSHEFCPKTFFWPTSYYEWCEMDEGNYPQLFMLAPYCNSSRCIMYDGNSHAACDGPVVGAYLALHSMFLCLRIFTSKNMLACSIVVSITIIMTTFTAHFSKYPKISKIDGWS